MNLEKIFQAFIKKQNLEDQKILLMVSGGVDSMVLLGVATKVIDKKNIAVFHLDHNVRKDSHKDLTFVQNTCSSLSIQFYSEKLKTINNSYSKKLPSSKENQWRKLRQNFSQQVAKKFGATKIITAHHATDLVETMIFRLTKGCGVDGLSPFDITTKPFWEIPKTEIIKYAQKNNIKWKIDPTNTNIRLERNLIRNNILPELRKITPNLEKVFVRESKIFAETQRFILKSIKMHKHQISLEQFHELPKTLQQEWLRKIAKKTPSAKEIEDALKWLNNHPAGNSHKKIGETELYINRGKIKC